MQCFVHSEVHFQGLTSVHMVSRIFQSPVIEQSFLRDGITALPFPKVTRPPEVLMTVEVSPGGTPIRQMQFLSLSDSMRASEFFRD